MKTGQVINDWTWLDCPFSFFILRSKCRPNVCHRCVCVITLYIWVITLWGTFIDGFYLQGQVITLKVVSWLFILLILLHNHPRWKRGQPVVILRGNLASQAHCSTTGLWGEQTTPAVNWSLASRCWIETVPFSIYGARLQLNKMVNCPSRIAPDLWKVLSCSGSPLASHVTDKHNIYFRIPGATIIILL